MRLSKRRGSHMSTPILSSSASAWRHLVGTSGFDPTGYDQPLVVALRDPTGLGLDPAREIEQELEDRRIPIEDFLAAFFRAMKPYGRMLQDLLDLFVEAGAQFGEHNLAVEFDFGRGVDLGFDVEQFRQWMTQWNRALRSAAEAQWNTNQLWQLVEILRHRGDGGPTPPELERWNLEYFERRRWPEARVSLPASGDRELDELLLRAWRLWETALRECAAQSRDRQDLNQKLHQGRNRPNREQEAEENPWPLEVLASLDSDHWPASLVSGLITTAIESRSRHIDRESLDALKQKLSDLFGSVPSISVQLDAWVLEWLAYLDLPLWKQRHELYSAWVATQILAATEPLPRRVHCEDRALRFEFRGSHVATLPTLDPAVHLWAELRSPINHRPVGISRKTKIQPDYTLLCDPMTGRHSAFLVVECKQYKTSSRKNFLAALIDYARGRPDAAILLVNYGPAHSDWVDEAPPELRDRLHLIGEFRPGSEEALGRFRHLVGERLALRALPAESPRSQSSDVVEEGARPDPTLHRVTLRWTRARDLDLHVLLARPERTYHVRFSDRGSLSREPWMALDADVQQSPGSETIELSRFFGSVYRCFVHSWSGERIEDSEAEVEVEFQGSTVRVTCPRNSSGRWWHVFDWDSSADSLWLVDRLAEEGPSE